MLLVGINVPMMPGCGKTAFLANWVKQRSRGSENTGEVILSHYAGCSYDSVKVCGGISSWGVVSAHKCLKWKH